MSGPKPKGVRWALDTLGPGESQFIKAATKTKVQEHIYDVRRRQGILKDVPLVVQPTASGVIVRRVE